MQNLLDVEFDPSLYLDRDKQALQFIEDRLLHQEACATVCMYGNGKDYLFSNLVKRLSGQQLTHKLKVLNTVSSDELRDFADMLIHDAEPTLCLVNLRMGKDVSWFIDILHELRVKRGRAFVSYVNAYAGDVYEALRATARPITHSMVVLQRVPYKDALHILTELSDRFEFHPSEVQKQDIHRWSYGHVGLLRTLYLLKRQAPDKAFTAPDLLREPSVLERLSNILRDMPAETLNALQQRKLGFVEQAMLEQLGYVDESGELFHPLLLALAPEQVSQRLSAFSVTELRVLEYLRQHADTVVSREEIARIVWGEEEWPDKYSDWAIGQLIYRLRRKLAYGSSPSSIKTRKAQGFVWVD